MFKLISNQIVNDFTRGAMKNLKSHIISLVLISLAGLSTALADTSTPPAGSVKFDFLASSPEGSWQLREDSDTNHKGKQTISLVKTSILGKETRNGKLHYWIEMGVDTLKVSKKGKRKPKGKRMVIKSLIAEESLRGDSANILKNLRSFGEEVIIQTGNETPMRMNTSGDLIGNMMNTLGAEIRYDFTNQGSETVNTPAGDFTTDKINGKGTVDMNVIFKKIHVESDNTMWISSEVPFGIVQQSGTTITNGKSSTQTSKLLEYGMSGATSEIVKEPENMPDIGNLFGG